MRKRKIACGHIWGRSCPLAGLYTKTLLPGWLKCQVGSEGEEEEGRQQQPNRHRELGPFLQGAAGGHAWHQPAGLIKQEIKKKGTKSSQSFLPLPPVLFFFFFFKSSLEALSI